MRALIEKPAQNNEEEEGEAEVGRKRRGTEEKFSYTIPPVEEATTSLADLFTKLDDSDKW